MVRKPVIAIIFWLLLLPPAWPCSFAPGYELFKLDPNEEPKSGATPETPKIHLRSISRGFDDGNFASCSDAGILTLVVLNSEVGDRTGYTFRVLSGNIEQGTIPTDIIAPIQLSDREYGFFFVWLDSGEPIDAKIEIRPVSQTGLEGKPVVLEIRHPA